MYSQCPECQTRFRVTADALRAAHGTVLCGRCGCAFDALERLSDSIPPATPDLLPAGLSLLDVPATDAPTDAEQGAPLSSDDLERVFVGSTDWHGQFDADASTPSEGTEPAAGDGEPAFLVVDEDAAVENITLEGDHVAAPGESAEPWAAEIRAALEPTPAEAPADRAREPQQDLRRPGRGWSETEEPEPRVRSAFWGALAWTAGSVVLALALAAQLVHHYRQDLVRHPQVGPYLRGAYERLGLPLLANWDLAAFELRQWGSDADATARGQMVVRASLKNRAAFAQPHPILRLELEDRFGATVATRDFEPADYLKNPSESSRLMAPGATGEAELVLADPGAEAVGYRLDVCLRESASVLRCAQGPG